ncbi:DUF2235 domain-containing protein [Mycena chlorophos]|uniref:DUF2235 domain-containing protein n=1 Tax=Mycena chlorophos TaxID=658473 RepID=A0A8H6T0T6_MYCCL|nr:DUF2235 domain-containing protein [Mycena chlorophos]
MRSGPSDPEGTAIYNETRLEFIDHPDSMLQYSFSGAATSFAASRSAKATYFHGYTETMRLQSVCGGQATMALFGRPGGGVRYLELGASGVVFGDYGKRWGDGDARGLFCGDAVVSAVYIRKLALLSMGCIEARAIPPFLFCGDQKLEAYNAALMPSVLQLTVICGNFWHTAVFSIRDTLSSPIMSKSPAQALLEKADKKANSLSGWFSSANSKWEEAGDLFQEAANAFKVDKMFKEAGDAFAREAECRENSKEISEAADAWGNAAKAYKMGFPQLAVQAFSRMITHLTYSGRFRQAAEREKDVAQVHLRENNDLRKACESYERAADWYAQEDAVVMAHACYKDAADLHADLEEYPQAIVGYEKVAEYSLSSNLTKYGVKEYWLRSGLCSLAMRNDTVSANRNFGKYSGQDPSYPPREAKFVQNLIKAVEAGDSEAFTAAVVEFDEVIKLDNWKTGMLLKIKRTLQAADRDVDPGIM